MLLNLSINASEFTRLLWKMYICHYKRHHFCCFNNVLVAWVRQWHCLFAETTHIAWSKCWLAQWVLPRWVLRFSRFINVGCVVCDLWWGRKLPIRIALSNGLYNGLYYCTINGRKTTFLLCISKALFYIHSSYIFSSVYISVFA